jgi:uncharacterized Zn finger protein (UPF0148 family)
MDTFFTEKQKHLEVIAKLNKKYPNYTLEEITRLVNTCPICKSRLFSSTDGKFNFCPECLIHFKDQDEILRIWISSVKNIDKFLSSNDNILNQ